MVASSAVSEPAAELQAVERLAQQLAGARSIVVLTGAGVSTDSGIPDYRDEAGAWKHRQPMKFQQFTRSLTARQRYWARSWVGFDRVDAALPNTSHFALAELERRGRIGLLVTQNVDGLHQKGGSQRVIDLHGRLDTVECLGCHAELSRREFQVVLSRLNPSFGYHASASAPDGDADLTGVDYEKFLVPPCLRCGGMLKPGVVFFGESVPAFRVERSLQALHESDALVVVGSSLMVFSGYRFARAAAKRQIPIYIINRGKTRGDGLATLKLDMLVGHALPTLVRELDWES